MSYLPSQFGGPPQGPSLTYTSGTIGAGLFTTDYAAIDSTTVLAFSSSVLGQFGDFWAQVPLGTAMGMTDGQGRTLNYKLTAIANASGGVQLNVAILGGSALSLGLNWSGVYTIQVMPAFASAATTSSMARTDDITLAAIQLAAGVTPVADGTVSPVTSITTSKGFVTADS